MVKKPNFRKMAESVPWLSILAGVFVIMLFFRMTTRNGLKNEGLQHGINGSSGVSNRQQEACNVQDAVQNGSNVMPNSSAEGQLFASVPPGSEKAGGLPNSCAVPQGNEPASLLPKDAEDGTSSLNPGRLKDVPLLKAGWLRGVDTVGASLRNANLQVRSEPPNPQVKVSPWMNSTIQPDLMRVPLEVGCGPPCNGNNTCAS